MIIMNIKAGLGNQLFQYAFGRALSIRNNDELKLDISSYKIDTVRSYGLNHFNTIEKFASLEEIQRTRFPLGKVSEIIFKTKVRLGMNNVSFNPQISNVKGDVYLDGYWQSEKYFKIVRSVLLREFSLRDPLSEKAEKYRSMISNAPQSVSLHVRRTDYVANRENIEHYGSYSDQGYYSRALSYITGKIRTDSISVFVFSDDIRWVKENLDIPYDKTYVSEHDAPDYERMTLMSFCSYHIITNSTFGWWGAWLDDKKDKIVVAPKIWIPGLNLPIDDIIPPEWIKV